MKKNGNPLTAWIHEFLSYTPHAKPALAWRHLAQTAKEFPQVIDWLIGFDQVARVVIYRRSVNSVSQRIGKSSFDKQFSRIRQRRNLSDDVPSMARCTPINQPE
jgi:hypothetical protein